MGTGFVIIVFKFSNNWIICGIGSNGPSTIAHCSLAWKKEEERDMPSPGNRIFPPKLPHISLWSCFTSGEVQHTSCNRVTNFMKMRRSFRP